MVFTLQKMCATHCFINLFRMLVSFLPMFFRLLHIGESVLKYSGPVLSPLNVLSSDARVCRSAIRRPDAVMFRVTSRGAPRLKLRLLPAFELLLERLTASTCRQSADHSRSISCSLGRWTRSWRGRGGRGLLIFDNLSDHSLLMQSSADFLFIFIMTILDNARSFANVSSIVATVERRT